MQLQSHTEVAPRVLPSSQLRLFERDGERLVTPSWTLFLALRFGSSLWLLSTTQKGNRLPCSCSNPRHGEESVPSKPKITLA